MSDKPWFESDAENIAKDLQSQVEQLEKSPSETKRRDELLYDLELYHGRKLENLYSVTGGNYERLWRPEDLVFNVCYAVVGTIRNRIVSFRPRAQFLPNGGDYKARRAGRDRTAMSDAWAKETAYQAEASLMLRDMLTGDGGVLKVYKECTKATDGSMDTVVIGRFPSWEFLFDEVEGQNRKPECAYHVQYIPIEQAARRYKIERSALASAICSPPASLIYSSNRQLVRTVEAWQNGPNGKHIVVAGENVIGKVEPWTYDGPPLITRTFDEGTVGVWGSGAIRPIRSLQLEMNEHAVTLREAHRQSAVKIINYQANEDVSKLLTNAYVIGVPYVNAPATITTPPAINPEAYQYFELLESKAYAKLGVSQYMASGTRRPGATSQPAMQEESELQSDRLAGLSQVWEVMRSDAAVWWNRLSIELARAGVQVKWKALHRGAYKEIVFEDGDAEWMIEPMPTSLFGQSMAGRLDRAVTLIKGGFMSKEDAMRALDLPDLEPIIDQMLAQSYAMEWLVDGILEDGQYQQPDPYIDPRALDAYAKNRYFLAISDGSAYPEDHLSKMRRLIDANTVRLKAAQAAATPAPPAPTASPPPANPALMGASPELLQQGAAAGPM